MAQFGDSTSKITAKLPKNLLHPIPICWYKSSIVLMDTLQAILKGKRIYYTARQLVETPYRLAQSAVSQPLIDIKDVYAPQTERVQLVSISNS